MSANFDTPLRVFELNEGEASYTLESTDTPTTSYAVFPNFLREDHMATYSSTSDPGLGLVDYDAYKQ